MGGITMQHQKRPTWGAIVATASQVFIYVAGALAIVLTAYDYIINH